MYNLFISHSWSYSDKYDRLVEMLDAAPRFEYKNYSVPKDDPIHNANNSYELKEAIKRQIIPSSCVLIMAGVYSTYSKWINIEIELACAMNKPILAIAPWGAERISSVVKNNANEVVRWNTGAIVDTIRRWSI